MNIHISGANGFLGQALHEYLTSQQVSSTPWVRKPSGLLNEVVIQDLTNNDLVVQSLKGCDVFVHLAAKVHQLKPNKEQLDPDYIKVNANLTLFLAKKCVNAGVKHFIYLSSVKVNGEYSYRPFVESDTPQPSDPYGFSKLEAELGLLELSKDTGLIVTIIRPPLVYGPGVRANFLNLLSWLNLSLPVPFRLIKNQRSLLFIGNLVSAIGAVMFCLPTKSGVFFVNDGHDLSSHELCTTLSSYLRSLNVSLPLPNVFLKKFGDFIGRGAQMSRLLGSLQIDGSRFRGEFCWAPPYTVEDGLKATATWFLDRQKERRRYFVKRSYDIVLSLIALFILGVPILFVALSVKLTSRGPVLYWSQRVGADNRIFMMPKFRSMRIGTPVVATHLLNNPEVCLTPIGGFLRRTSLDELPQLICVLRGQMSLVGPRPALFNQHDLIYMRTQAKVHKLVPGLTGWAQINGRDELDLPIKVSFDLEYLKRRSTYFDLKILFLTFFKVLGRKNIAY